MADRYPVNIGLYGRSDEAFSSSSTQPQSTANVIINAVKDLTNKYLAPNSEGEVRVQDASMYKVAKKAASAYKGFDFLFPFGNPLSPNRRKK